MRLAVHDHPTGIAVGCKLLILPSCIIPESVLTSAAGNAQLTHHACVTSWQAVAVTLLPGACQALALCFNVCFEHHSRVAASVASSECNNISRLEQQLQYLANPYLHSDKQSEAACRAGLISILPESLFTRFYQRAPTRVPLASLHTPARPSGVHESPGYCSPCCSPTALAVLLRAKQAEG